MNEVEWFLFCVGLGMLSALVTSFLTRRLFCGDEEVSLTFQEYRDLRWYRQCMGILLEQCTREQLEQIVDGGKLFKLEDAPMHQVIEGWLKDGLVK